jgi:hypothetical protein
MAKGEPAQTPEAHNTVARLLGDNTEAVVQGLRRPAATTQSVLSALVAARTVADVIDKGTRLLVRDARVAGHTWEEIGQMLGISSRAAKRRFAAAARDTQSNGSLTLQRRSTQIVEQIRDADWDAVTADWDETMRVKLPIQRVAEVWQQVSSQAGPLQALGRPSIVRRGPYRIADVPLAFEHGPMKARITFNHDDSVGGLFILVPDAD